jgi:hypothetical protein
MLRLPVSGLQIAIRQPTGAEDVLLQEVQPGNAALALELIGRLVRAVDEAPANWRDLPVSDLEALLLMIRQAVVGDTISTDTCCPAPGCGARVDVAFGIGKYLASRRVRTVKDVEKGAEENWFRLRGEGVEFRLPAAGDLLAIERGTAPERELQQRCIRPAGLKPALRRRAENAMEAMAPRYSADLSGTCPECGTVFDVHFDVRSFVLQELRNHGASVYQDVHLLALHYKWPEDNILALPRNRRSYYAEMLRDPEVAN